MGLDEDMLDCIRALAENRIQDAKDKAIICCINDTTKRMPQRHFIIKNYWRMAQQKCLNFHSISKDCLMYRMCQTSMKPDTILGKSRKDI